MGARAAALLGAAALLLAGAGPPALFREAARERGLDFHHFNGWTGKRFIVEITGSGVALFDADGDGDLDALLLTGAPLPGTAPQATRHRCRLFLNDGTGRFADATDGAGIDYDGFAYGVAVGDVDGDGDEDVLITGYRKQAFYRNRGDGTFENATDQAGLRDDRWTTSAVFFDYDGDGDLDLYVAAYGDFDPATHVPCTLRGREIYCGPDKYHGLPDRLYRNDGHGRFTDVTERAGMAGATGLGLGVLAFDYDNDGDQDLYVANDSTPNFLFLNHLDQGKAAFTEEALMLGAAYGPSAKAEAGMGVDAGDYDDDGDLDVTVTNIDNQTNSLYRNDGDFVMESSYAVGLGAPTLPRVGFGTRFLDYDLDGDLDLVVTNGHIMDNVGEIRQGAQFAQPNMIFENRGGTFVEACKDCLPKGVGRGLAVGDVDGDGDEDFLVNNNGGAPYLFLNVAERRGEAIGLRLEGAPPRSNRDAYGARVSWTAWGKRRIREVHAGGSFCSSSDPRLLLAVPAGTAKAPVTIRWPDGKTETLSLAPGAYHHVVEGRGVVASVAFHTPSGR
jgi:enediyne biosynthesis protein E4